jgi:hypothetical protein
MYVWTELQIGCEIQIGCIAIFAILCNVLSVFLFLYLKRKLNPMRDIHEYTTMV